MSELDELKARIDRLESRAAITELISAYAVACDEHDIPRLGSLFCTDAVLDTPNGTMVARGRDAIEAMFIEVFKIRGPAFHWTHDVTITFDDNDPNRASGLALCHAETSPNGIASVAALRYHDTYRREDGVWRIATRALHFLYYAPMTEIPNVLNATKRVTIGGERLAADYPESLPAWQAFNEHYMGRET